MTSDTGEDEMISIHETVSVAELDPEVYEGQQFSIKAVSLDGEFDIGLSHAGGGEPPKDILEPELYESIEARIRSVIDINTVKSHTTTQIWPKIGSVRVDFGENGDVELSIEVSNEWIAGSC